MVGFANFHASHSLAMTISGPQITGPGFQRLYNTIHPINH